MRHRSLPVLLFLLACAAPARAATKLYWFVPDGLRADPKVCDVFGWARAGKLPNIKKLMERGAWGYSKPVFPSHTPVNFATLMTGALPETHGVSDGPMRALGQPLAKPSVNGFSSAAKRVAPIWRTLEKAGLKVAVVSVPGSTPPELDAGWTLRGRWSGWGADFHALNFESLLDPKDRASRGNGVRLFYMGPELTRQVPVSPGGVMTMLAYGTTVYANIAPDGLRLALADGKEFAKLSKSDEWTEWRPITLSWQDRRVPTHFRAGLIKLGPGRYAKVRLLFDTLNDTIVQPAELAGALEQGVGPMVDFPDNWPAQLNRLPEERDVFLTESGWALDWHRRAAARLLSVEKPDVIIQDTYVPNQMLESRWWLKHLDPAAPAYATTPEADRRARAEELLKMYQGIDAVIGEALKAAGPDALIVLSSDHGVIPVKKEVLVNNLLAKEGLLVFSLDPATGEPVVDWTRSKAAFLKMIGVYVNPAGLAGPWKRGSGPEYEALRRRVQALLADLSDGNARVVKEVVPWEEAAKLKLPRDRVPDLVLSMTPGYALTEDMDKSGDILRDSVQSGYKQAVDASDVPSLWSPFVIAGPGVRRGFKLPAPVTNADQAPTLLKLLGVKAPDYAQGRVISELLAK